MFVVAGVCGVGGCLGPGRVVLCLCEFLVWILCVYGRSRYLF